MRAYKDGWTIEGTLEEIQALTSSKELVRETPKTSKTKEERALRKEERHKREVLERFLTSTNTPKVQQTMVRVLKQFEGPATHLSTDELIVREKIFMTNGEVTGEAESSIDPRVRRAIQRLVYDGKLRELDVPRRLGQCKQYSRV